MFLDAGQVEFWTFVNCNVFSLFYFIISRTRRGYDHFPEVTVTLSLWVIWKVYSIMLSSIPIQLLKKANCYILSL